MPQSLAGHGFLLPIFRWRGSWTKPGGRSMVLWLVGGSALSWEHPQCPPEGHVSPLLVSDPRTVVPCFRGLWPHRWQRMVARITVSPQTASLPGSSRHRRSGLRECPFYRWAHRGQVTLRNPPRGPGCWRELLRIPGAAELCPPSCVRCGSAAPRAQQEPCSQHLLHASPGRQRWGGGGRLSPAPPAGPGHHGTR